MIFKLQVVVIADDGHPETCEITSVERRDLKPETLGLTLAEGKAILKGIQQLVIQRQAATCLAPYQQCLDCGSPRTSKGYHDLSLRTVFGCLKVKSPRLLYHCDCRPHETKTFRGEDTKRNFKHVKRRRLSRVDGSGADGTDLDPTSGTFLSGSLRSD